MPPKGKSSEIVIAAKLGVTYRTAEACGANNGIKAKPGWEIDKGQGDVEDDSMGSAFIQDSDNTEVRVAVNLQAYMRYTGLELLLAQAMGSVSVSYQSAILHSGTSNAANSDATHLEYLGAGFGTSGELDDAWLTCRTGTGAYQVRQIISHTDTILTVAAMTDPAGDTTFEVSAYAPADIGQADASGAATLIDATKSAIWTVDLFEDLWVKNITTGEIRGIVSNTTDTLTVAGNWDTPPTGTDLYEIFGGVAALTYTQAADNFGQFLTLAVDNNINVDEVPSGKLTGLTLSGQVGQSTEIQFPMIGNNREVASAINTQGTMQNVTIRETSNRAMYNQLAVRQNDQAGAALSSENIYPNSFSLALTMPKRGVYGTTTGFEEHDEPQTDDFNRSELTLEFEDYTAVTNFTKWAANTKQKLDFIFTGAVIQDAVTRSLTINIPNAKIGKASLPYDIGLFKHPVTMMCHEAGAGAPSGMTDTKPFEFVLVTNYGGDPSQLGND